MTATPAPPNGIADLPASATARLVARERVHAMESLAGLIAHELRAAVLGVTSAAQLLRYSVPQDPVAERSLGRILQESERLSALHEALTEYATELPARFEPGNPDDVWRNVSHAMRGALEAQSVLLTHAGPSATSTCAIDREQLGRAFERCLHHALGRVQSGAELDVVSTTEGGTWTSTISANSAESLTKAGFERAGFHLALAHRTLVAHGGEAIEGDGVSSLLVTIRLPLSGTTA